jgi:hypothetical protein
MSTSLVNIRLSKVLEALEPRLNTFFPKDRPIATSDARIITSM